MEVVNSVLVALVVAVVEVVVSKYISHFYLGDIGKYKIKIIEFEYCCRCLLPNRHIGHH